MGWGGERVFGGGKVTLREANKCSCAVIYHQLGICRGRAGTYNDISLLYACTFVALNLVRWVVLSLWITLLDLWICVWIVLCFLLASVIQRRLLS